MSNIQTCATWCRRDNAKVATYQCLEMCFGSRAVKTHKQPSPDLLQQLYLHHQCQTTLKASDRTHHDSKPNYAAAHDHHVSRLRLHTPGMVSSLPMSTVPSPDSSRLLSVRGRTP